MSFPFPIYRANDTRFRAQIMGALDTADMRLGKETIQEDDTLWLWEGYQMVLYGGSLTILGTLILDGTIYVFE
jgi:hypothetical protein